MLSYSRSFLLLVASASVFTAGLTACGDDPKPNDEECVSTSSFTCASIPRIEIVPAGRHIELVASTLTAGQTTTRAVRVINVGEAALSLRSIELRYAPPEGGSDGTTPAFRLVPLAASLPLSIYPLGGSNAQQSLDILIEFTRPGDALPRDATLVLTSNDPLEPNRESRVTLTTAVGAPALSVPENPIDFGLVPERERRERATTLLNTGTRELTVTRLQLQGDGRFGFKGDGFAAEGSDAMRGVTLDPPLIVPAGETRPLTLTFLSDAPTPATGAVLVFSDDPTSGANGFVLNLIANKSGPCITVHPAQISFRGKTVGSVSTIDFEIESCGTEPIKVNDIQLSDESSPDFSLDFSRLPAGFETDGPSASNPLSIPINERVRVGVVFVPDSINPRDADNLPIPDEGTVLVISNGYRTEVPVTLSGSGAEAECPTAIITVQEGEEVIPQTVVHLSGLNSYAPFGAVTRYQWTVTRPDGTPPVLMLPNFTDPRPLAELNSVGLYRFKLNVRDEFGNSSGGPSCPDATYDILVQPDQAIHVELTWETPGDPDPSDEGPGKGADLDLHFAHHNAQGPDLDGDGAPDPWFDTYWDVFWYNRNPDWATLGGGVNDNPSLDRDDTDGGGPENLNLSIPEDGVSYRIGVHSWKANGFGSSHATVKVFHYADLVYEQTLRDMNERDLWCVGTIHWPTPAVERCADEGDPEQVTPNYVNAFFQPY